MKVLIVGAGLAGTTLAFWLSKLGYNITVLERASSLRTGGLQIDLRGYAIDVLKRMGLEEGFRAKAVKEEGIQFVDSSGKRRAWFPANNDAQSFSTEHEIMRGDLCQLFYDATKERVKYVFGNSVQHYEENDSGLEVRFKDGRTEHFDLLLGADGQNSRMRKMLTGSDTNDGLYPLDDIIAYYTIPQPDEKGEGNIATGYLATQGRMIMVRRSNPYEIQAYIGCKAHNERMSQVSPGDVEGQKQALRDIYKGAGWKTEDIANGAAESTNFYCVRLGVVKLDSWSKGRVALVGDAAWCPSPNTGMGTTSSILGAYILAGEIGRHCGQDDAASAATPDQLNRNLAAAFKSYDAKFRPFVDFIQKGVLEQKGVQLPQSTMGIYVANLFLGVLSALRLNIMGLVSIKAVPKGWELPGYGDVFSD